LAGSRPFSTVKKQLFPEETKRHFKFRPLLKRNKFIKKWFRNFFSLSLKAGKVIRDACRKHPKHPANGPLFSKQQTFDTNEAKDLFPLRHSRPVALISPFDVRMSAPKT